MCKERREKVTNKLVKFICQLSVDNAKVAVGTLKKPICFIKRDRRKQLTLPVIIIRLDNNSQTDTRALIDSRCTRSYINQ